MIRLAKGMSFHQTLPQPGGGTNTAACFTGFHLDLQNQTLKLPSTREMTTKGATAIIPTIPTVKASFNRSVRMTTKGAKAIIPTIHTDSLPSHEATIAPAGGRYKYRSVLRWITLGPPDIPPHEAIQTREEKRACAGWKRRA